MPPDLRIRGGRYRPAPLPALWRVFLDRPQAVEPEARGGDGAWLQGFIGLEDGRVLQMHAIRGDYKPRRIFGLPFE